MSLLKLDLLENFRAVAATLTSQALEVLRGYDSAFEPAAIAGLTVLDAGDGLAVSFSWQLDPGPTIIIRPEPGTFMGDVLLVSNGSIEQPEVQAALDRLVAERFPYWRVFDLPRGHPFQRDLWPTLAKPALYEAIQGMGELPTSRVEQSLLNCLARRCGGWSFEGLASVRVMDARSVGVVTQEGGRPRGKGGAPRLKDRLDWPAKVEIAKRWVDQCKRGRTTQEDAAQTIGHDVETLRSWAREAGLI